MLICWIKNNNKKEESEKIIWWCSGGGEEGFYYLTTLYALTLCSFPKLIGAKSTSILLVGTLVPL